MALSTMTVRSRLLVNKNTGALGSGSHFGDGSKEEEKAKSFNDQANNDVQGPPSHLRDTPDIDTEILNNTLKTRN